MVHRTRNRIVSPGLDFTVTTKIPNNPYIGCTVFLKKSLNDCSVASCNPPPLTASVLVQPAIDNRPPNPPRRSHPRVVGVTVDSSLDVQADVPICVKISSNGAFVPNVGFATLYPNVASAIGPLVALLETGVLGRMLGDPSGGSADPAGRAGVLGALSPLAAAVVVDAFTNPRYLTDRNGETFFAETEPPIAFDVPEWIHLDDGVTLSLRRTPGIEGSLPVP